MAKDRKSKIGGWAFLIGVVLAIVLGAMQSINTTWLIILVVIGLIVGFLNVTEHEVSHFLMSATVLIIVSALGSGVMAQIPILGRILDALLVIFVPATVIVAIKNVFTIARH